MSLVIDSFMLLLMPIKVLPRDYEFEYRLDSLLSSKCHYRVVLQDKLFSGTHTTKHTTRTDLDFIQLSITATLHWPVIERGECLQKMILTGSYDLHAKLIVSGEEDHSI